MENPGYSDLDKTTVSEISSVIKLLVESPPSIQQETIERYFTPSAAFVHPFCRVPSYNGSRWTIIKIFQWYKIMSPRIEHQIHSIAYDEQHLTLYITLSQIFSIWLVPFHVSPVRLTTVINLTTDSGEIDDQKPMVNGDYTRYYIAKQEDLYQVSEWIKFLVPHVGHLIVLAFQSFATLFCIVGVAVFYPILWLEERRYIPYKVLRKGNLVYNIERKIPEIRA
ncbi:uncharacterized protein ACLA_087380 [Aspergillus clavatus NRRL 1]|uniref:SigF-like NTF2-like domain-containing protein n=1 Tax=Aspergillus clavatus (strain ATCC 1007 / CBS 513.65 / DSM 816 / NCTC 3887 / NRRL 1 / QM 1276 / 107) TaxID=344612 RepID=A1CUP6_ASPCL|nr:uncharacterized protein ACLA_087380 [Aspergillus clavatus NRRL 1]EAW07033.1 conserved hypothetical protein [Aspergillus clavatus NRRL 1]